MLQPVGQALVRHPQPGLDSAQRLVQPPGDLTVGEPLEVGQRYHASLLFGSAASAAWTSRCNGQPGTAASWGAFKADGAASAPSGICALPPRSPLRRHG